jgi:hypothetical protein
MTTPTDAAPDEDVLSAADLTPGPDGARVRRVLAVPPYDQRLIRELDPHGRLDERGAS